MKMSSFSGDEYKPEISPVTFFQEVNRNRTPGSASHGISPMGFVPNSVLVKILYPPPTPPPDPASLRPYRPPKLTAKQLSEIKALKKVGSAFMSISGTLNNRPATIFRDCLSCKPYFFGSFSFMRLMDDSLQTRI